MEKIIIAGLVGLSMTNLGLCIFTSFGISSMDKKTGAMFIFGRILGICAIGIFIGLVGYDFVISGKVLAMIFGLISIIFGIGIIYKRKIKTILGIKKSQKCSYKNTNAFEGKGKTIGFGLGAFRGATPCLKIIILVPLLINSDFLTVVLMMIVFALTSSIYPIIGFLFADTLKKLTSKRRIIELFGAVILIIIGIFYVFKYFEVGGCNA